MRKTKEHKEIVNFFLGFRKLMSQLGISNNGAINSRDWA